MSAKTRGFAVCGVSAVALLALAWTAASLTALAADRNLHASAASAPLITPTPIRTPTHTPTPGISPTYTPACGGPAPWSEAPTMTVPRAYGAGVATNDGASDKLYVISGAGEAPYTASVERYDPATNTWTSMAPIPTPGAQMRGAALGPKIYVPGGYNETYGGAMQRMQIFYTNDNYWTICPYWMPEAVFGAGVAAYNNKIYIIGGTHADGSFTGHVWEHDPYANTYTAKADLPIADSYLGAVEMGGRIYVFGGHSHYLSYGFDPLANTWTALAPGPTPNFQSPGVFALNGQIWVVGGSTENNLPYPPGQQVHIYNPVADNWYLGPPLNTPRMASSAAGAVTGRGYVAGGSQGGTSYLNGVESVAYLPCLTVTPTPSATRTPQAAYTATPLLSPTPTPTQALLTATATGTPDPATATPIPTQTTAATGTPGATCTATPLPSATPAPTQASPTATAPSQPATSTATGTRTATPPNTATTTPHTILTPCTILYPDVPPGSPFYTFVQCLACRGVVSGYADGTFRPYNHITRGQVSKIVSNAARLDDDITGRQTYADVPPANPFWTWVERLTLHGVMSGYGCGGPGEPCDGQNRPYFRWANNATRAQVAKIASNTAGYEGDPTAQTFADVPPAHPFYPWIERLAARQIISGYPCGGPAEPCDSANRPYFRYANNVTRGQAAKIMASTFFPDCTVR